jgi:hypothetical protein
MPFILKNYNIIENQNANLFININLDTNIMFWTLSIVMSLSKKPSCLFFKT